MSLIKCPDCGNNVSTREPSCPHCGRPLTAKEIQVATELNGKRYKLYIVISVLKAAESKNAENLLILQSPELAKLYTENWKNHKEHSEPYEPRD